jgi:hypothetical protein
MAEPRRPAAIPDHDPGPGPADVSAGFDTDGDGHPDTTVADDGVDLVLLTDLDGDGFADRLLRIGPDGITREVGYRPAEHPTDLPD